MVRATIARQIDRGARRSNRGGGGLAVVAAGLAVLALPAIAARAQQADGGSVAIQVERPSIRHGDSTKVTAVPALPPTATSLQYHWSVSPDGSVTPDDQQQTTVTLDVPGPHTVTLDVTYVDGSDPTGSRVIVSTSETVQATNDPPTVKINQAPATAELGRSYQLRAEVSDSDGDAPSSTWSDSLSADFAGAGDMTTWTPRARGTHTVTVTAHDGFGGFDSAPVNITVPDRQPRATFTVSGTGLTRTLRSTSGDPDDDPLAHAWSVSGGGRLSATDTRTATVRFPGPGVYVVRLTVSERNGTLSDRESDTVVIEPDLARRLIEPFPVVRIRGRVFRGATKFDVFSVMAPKGSHIRIRCAGRSCRERWSAASMRRTRWRRFHGFERRMRAGTVLQIFVVQPGRIGKYTRFGVRASKPPSRRDRCLSAVERLRVIRCPAG